MIPKHVMISGWNQSGVTQSVPLSLEPCNALPPLCRGQPQDGMRAPASLHPNLLCLCVFPPDWAASVPSWEEFVGFNSLLFFVFFPDPMDVCDIPLAMLQDLGWQSRVTMGGGRPVVEDCLFF